MGRPRRTIHIDRKTELLWKKDDALCLVKGLVYQELLKSGETVNTKRYQQHFTDLKLSLLEKKARKRSNQKR